MAEQRPNPKIIYFAETNPRVNTLRQRQSDRHLTDDIFKYIFLDGDILIFDKYFTEICFQVPN